MASTSASTARNTSPVAAPPQHVAEASTAEAVMATGDAGLLEQHRRRFVAPILQGRVVLDLDAGETGPEHRRATGHKADVVVALRARPGADLLRLLPDLCGRVRDDGVLAVAVAGEADRIVLALEAAFRHVRRFPQRGVAGSLIADHRFAEARATALADQAAGERSSCELLLCSNADLPGLSPGLFEDTGRSARPGPAARENAAEAGAPTLPASELQARAAALVDRLAAFDAERTAARHREAALRQDLEQASRNTRPVSDTRFDMPLDRYPWPLREEPGRTPDRLGLYDRRPDDDYVAVAKAGDAFLSGHGLLGDAPGFAAACAALNGMRRTLQVVPEAAGEVVPEAAGGVVSEPVGRVVPDVSIVIPVYGQLAYTLNCIDGLFAHQSRATVEIIVVDDVSPDPSREYLGRIDGIILHRQARNGGFIASSNAGAARARGRIIVMLNNDTRVLPGWLDLLVDSFALFPRAGLIGSKFLNPDGSLQEAGGILFRDGSAWNFGRGDDPNRPIYAHARQVDYVSGASIAIPAAVWHELGGFDPFFAPAYYEDTDLCFRLRAAGYETWYQSGSRLIHYEGRTSGTDTRTGVKSYQVTNARKFRLRHREALLRHRPTGEAPLLESDRAVRQRALVIEATCPTPKHDAGSVYTVSFLQVLRDIGYKPVFVPQDNFLFQPANTPALQHLGIECCYAPFQTNFEDFIRKNGALFDVVIVFRVDILERVVGPLRRHAPQAPLLFNNHDLHYLRMQRGAEINGDAKAAEDALLMKARELDLASKVDCIMTPSHYEVTVLAQELPGVKCIALPLMVPFDGTDVAFGPRRDVCFLGGYGHPPNVDAVAFFVRDVLPLLREQEPGIRFIIAGANPTDEVKALAGEDVVVTGFVDDLREVLDAVRVFVCPLRYGAGMKGKILTSMSYGVPVVSTSVGVEGIEATVGSDILVADTPEDIAAACLRLYRTEKLWKALSRNGQRMVREKHSMQRQHEVLRGVINSGFGRLFGVDAEDLPQAAE